MRHFALLASLLIPVRAAAQQPHPPVPPPLHVEVDSAHRRVLITGGPYRVPVSQQMPGMMMDMPATPVQKFAFPVDGWLQRFRTDPFDDHGHVLPHRLPPPLLVADISR